VKLSPPCSAEAKHGGAIPPLPTHLHDVVLNEAHGQLHLYFNVPVHLSTFIVININALYIELNFRQTQPYTNRLTYQSVETQQAMKADAAA
jgi:hypothetical protein